MGTSYFFNPDLVKQLNQRISDDGNDTGNDDTGDYLRKIPGKESNQDDKKDDEEKFVFLVQSGHASDFVSRYIPGSFRIALRYFHPEDTKILQFS